ncbi:large ribosomal subunit protein uL24m [Neodiprion pinetum]|uniref:Large ribosomal subunit protein uL24m n=1 Tax=Neodiprion lecontei TaxID=441921 RepID=A0A6J0B897_NEOLC|nr:probable 39S ribosomal protein L24, mitochondrial [Neodiprion lecontei]XP_046434186.1 probable 39S ribosomal protein L24, mitochondrial [Neodiprion fabricii]XP_046491520.1 probable 39S ribosomal protein L24, mitochondrial [Neodiprion pinetum]
MRLSAFLLTKVGDLTKKVSNLPEKYITDTVEKVYYRTPRAIQYLDRTIKRKNFRFTTNRPWSGPAEFQNSPHKYRKKVFVEPLKDWNFFKGDRVQLLVGRDKGKQGIITQVIQERNWVIVEGLNTHLRRIGKDKDFPGSTVQSEAPLLVTTDIRLVDPSDLDACDVEWRYKPDGQRVRVSCRTGRIIPIPHKSEETVDYKRPTLYKAKQKDTPANVVKEVTFLPELKTFEMDLMDKMGIKEDRTRKPIFWY